MPDGQFPNPLAAIANTVRQVNEQTNQMVKSFGDSVTQTANQFLQATAQGLPALPGLPGASNNPGPRGNPNGGQAFPSPQQLLANPLQAVSQAEDVILPKGFPRPAGQLAQATRTRRVVTEQPAPTAADRPAPPVPARRRVVQMRGV